MQVLTTLLPASLLALSLSSCGCLIGCGCPGYEKGLVRLGSHTREWLPAAPPTTTVFENSRGQRQTVSLISYDAGSEEFFQGDECPVGKQEYVRARWAGPALPDTLELHLYDQRVNPEVQARFGGSFDVSQYRRNTTNTSYAASRQLGGRTFEVVVGVSCISQCNSQRVTELYVAKGLGLVAFQLQNELWVRQ